MSDIRDVLQHRTTHLAQSLRGADEFNLPAAKGVVKRKRTVRAVLVGSAATVAVLAIGAGAWAGYGAWRVGPATSESPSATPSDGVSETPSATPTPSEDATRLESATDQQLLNLAANPRTTEQWTDAAAYATDLDIIDLEYYFLAKVGEHDGADIVAVAPRSYDIYSGGRPITALLEVGGGEARVIACPMPVVAAPCTNLEGTNFGADTVVDENTFFDTLALPSEVTTAGGQVLGVATNAWLGDASDWTGLITTDPDYEPRPWANTVLDTPLGDAASSLVRAYGVAAVPELTAFDFAIRTPYGSYIPMLEEGISGMDGDGFSWDDGQPVTFYDKDACSNWGDQACPDRWLSAEQRCFPLTVTEDPNHADADWVRAGSMSDGRVAYVPVGGGNTVAKSVYTTMRDSSWDIESNEPNYIYETYKQFLAARPLITFQLDDGRWIVALAGSARNNPYECA